MIRHRGGNGFRRSTSPVPLPPDCEGRRNKHGCCGGGADDLSVERMGIAYRDQRPRNPDAQGNAERAHDIGGGLQDLNGLGITQVFGRLSEKFFPGDRGAALFSLSV